MINLYFQLQVHLTDIEEYKPDFDSEVILEIIEEETVHTSELENSAGHISGYLAFKLNYVYSNLFHKQLDECECCSSILGEETLRYHLYTSFKEYENTEKQESSLKYCSTCFIETVISWEKAFLYFFENWKNAKHFEQRVYDFISKNICSPLLCDMKLNEYVLHLFIRTRIYYSTNILNGDLSKNKSASKLRKLTHQ